MIALLALTFGMAAFTTGCGNDCEDAADRIIAKAEECGLDTGTSDGDGASGECTDEAGAAAQCAAGCYEAASCETLKGEDADGALAFAECASKC